MAGLQAAKAGGHELSQIHSVGSFFVSRVDTEIDRRLEKIGSDQALGLRGQAGVANARLAYAAYQEAFEGGAGYAALKADEAPNPVRQALGRRRRRAGCVRVLEYEGVGFADTGGSLALPPM